MGASNELPDSEELNALFDRFLLRVHVGPVTQAGFRTLLQLRGDLNIIIPDELQLSASDLNEIRQAAQETSVPPEVENLLSDLRDWCAAESIPVSDTTSIFFMSR